MIVRPMEIRVLPHMNYDDALKLIEEAGRTAYKTEDKITDESRAQFVKMILDKGHESVLEHVSVTVKFTIDRGVSHELVRHRLAAYTQESTRYVNYNKKGMEVIEPLFMKESADRGERAKYEIWLNAMTLAEIHYNALIDSGAKPEEARSVLPQSLKTDITTTYNLRQWRHVLSQRLGPHAHPQMRKIMRTTLFELHKLYPVIFEDLMSSLCGVKI